MNKSSCCSTSLPARCIVNILDFGHSNRCSGISLLFQFTLRNLNTLLCKEFKVVGDCKWKTDDIYDFRTDHSESSLFFIP